LITQERAVAFSIHCLTSTITVHKSGLVLQILDHKLLS